MQMDQMTRFPDMIYQRPDKEKTFADFEALISELEAASSYEEAKAVFLRREELGDHLHTAAVLAQVRHSIDTRDAFYNAEEDFFNELLPELAAYEQRWTLAMLSSPFRAQFEAEYGELMFLNAEIELRSFRPDIISEMQAENKLTQAYEKLLASAQIPFEGGVYTIAQIQPFKNDPHDALRLAAWEAEGRWFKDNQAEMDRLYDELVRLRDTMGKKLGYDDFIKLGYCRMQRNCYTKEDVERFRKAVRQYVVPLAEKLCREQAERIGKPYPLSFADAALFFRSGNSRPISDLDGILQTARCFYRGLSQETGDFFDTMLNCGTLDVAAREGKAGGGFCENLPDYRISFIFANFNGTQSDVETVTHEAGHAFCDWVNQYRVPAQYRTPSLEACEVHSMSMEFFAWRSAQDFFGADASKFCYSHLASAIKFIPYGTMVDHFQHIVYEKPQLSPKERHAVWKELLSIYMPWLRLDGEIPFYAEGEGWQRQHHIYSLPFYYIDYCLAQTVALQLWAMSQRDYDDAFAHYMAFTSQGGSRTFTELLKHAGLDSPFDESCLCKVCETAGDWLDRFDLSGIE